LTRPRAIRGGGWGVSNDPAGSRQGSFRGIFSGKLLDSCFHREEEEEGGKNGFEGSSRDLAGSDGRDPLNPSQT